MSTKTWGSIDCPAKGGWHLRGCLGVGQEVGKLLKKVMMLTEQ